MDTIATPNISGKIYHDAEWAPYISHNKKLDDKLENKLDSLFNEIKLEWSFNENQLKYWFFSPELSHKLFLLSENNKEKKETILNYLMDNIIDKELKREDIVFLFINDKTIITKNWEINIKERLIVRTNYYKAIWAIVKNKVKTVITPNTTRIEASKYKDIIDEIDVITQLWCFAPEFKKNPQNFELKKRQIIASTLKWIFWGNSTIVVPRTTKFDIHIRNNLINLDHPTVINTKTPIIENKKNVNFQDLEKKVFPTKSDLRKFLSSVANKVLPKNLLISQKYENIFTKPEFIFQIISLIKTNKEIRQAQLNSEELKNFAKHILEKDLKTDNTILNNIIKILLNTLNANTSKWLGFYNYLIYKILNWNIPADLYKKIDPKVRIQRSREYVRYERDVMSKKDTWAVNLELFNQYENDVLNPLVEALKIYMSK